MRKRLPYYPLLLSVPFLLTACLEPYDAPVVTENRNYLVVDAFLNADGEATVALSRTHPLYAEEKKPPEVGAVVQVEDESGNVHSLNEVRPGYYTGLVPVDLQATYRVRINTSGEHYLSDLVPVKLSPPIDSLYWRTTDNGLVIYADTHDPGGESIYYQWEVIETFEYTSAYNSVFMFDGGIVVPRPKDQQIFTCWKTDTIHHITLGTAEHLEVDAIRQQPVLVIPPGTRKTSILYSPLVRQRVLTAAGYEYYRKVKQNTESLGGLFDPMPSDVPGNFHDVDETGRSVIGFFSAGSISEKRIFISRNELPVEYHQFPSAGCELDTIPLEEIEGYIGKLLVGAVVAQGAPVIIGYTTSTRGCIDCTTLSGTATKPQFWTK